MGNPKPDYILKNKMHLLVEFTIEKKIKFMLNGVYSVYIKEKSLKTGVNKR